MKYIFPIKVMRICAYFSYSETVKCRNETIIDTFYDMIFEKKAYKSMVFERYRKKAY